MSEILVVAEHRQGELREITLEMLRKARELCEQSGRQLTALVLCGKDASFTGQIARRVDRVLLYEDDRLQNFDPDLYKAILGRVIEEKSPLLTLIGHTSRGMSFAPALAVKCGYPLATDCVDILLEQQTPKVIRQIYSGKVFSKVAFKESAGYLVTVRPGAFPPQEEETQNGGEVERRQIPADIPVRGREFVEIIDAGAGEVDISQADLLVSIGRGIAEEENIAVMRDLAGLLGGTLACSRPVVDKNWLPKYHQVGTSGKSVKPKVYLAFGISGAFQHVAGISGAGTVIAVNKDGKAPIFRVAHYGVADDLFNIAAALKEKLSGGK